MKKNNLKILIAACFWFFASISGLSQKNDSTEAYQYWAHRGIVEMVYAYMNDFIETVPDLDAKSELEGRDGFRDKFILDIDKKDLPSFDTISFFLITNNWKEADKRFFQPLVNNFNSSVRLDSSFFAAKKPGSNDLITVIPGENSNRMVYWNIERSKILKNYNAKLQNIAQKSRNKREKNKQEPIIEKSVDPIQQESRNEKDIESKWSFNLFDLSFFLFGVIIGGLLVFLISKVSIYSILNYEKDKYLHELKLSNERFIFKYIGLFHILKRSKNYYKNEYEKRDFNSEVANLKDQIKKLQLDYKTLEQKQTIPDKLIDSSNLENESNYSHELDYKQPEEVPRKLFFSMPESDGQFIINNGDSSNDGRKYYKIEYLESDDSGQLIYISSDRDKRAINRLESYLKPVCEIENINNADSATRIEFISPGKVHLLDDRWVIDTANKAKIKFI